MNELDQKAIEALSAGCNKAFQEFAQGASKQQRLMLWDAFRSGWLAHQMQAAGFVSSAGGDLK